MSLFVERTLDTKLGKIEIAITEQNHISVQGKPEFRGTKFNAHLHFFRLPSGHFGVRDQDNPSISYAWTDGMSPSKYRSTAPKTYLAKVIEEYTVAVNTFAIQNPALFVEAEDKHIESDISSAEAKIAKLNEELKAQRDILHGLQVRRHVLREGAKIKADAAKEQDIALTPEEEAESKAVWASLTPKEATCLASVRDRYIDERVKGRNVKGGKYLPPISHDEAKRSWIKAEKGFADAIKSNNEIRNKLQLDEVPA